MKHNVKVVYDRKKQIATKGVGVVELYIYLGGKEKSYLSLCTKKPEQWVTYRNSTELHKQVDLYQCIINGMAQNNEPMTIAHFNSKFVTTGHAPAQKSFVDFLRETIASERVKESTRRHKMVTLDAIVRFGRIKEFADVTVDNIRAFDKWLKHEDHRSDSTVNNYHKHLKKWLRIAYEQYFIADNPYQRVHFSKGKSKERQPLTEAELLKLRNMKVSGHLARARDLFIFAAYTGLAYCDVCAFDFFTMTEKIGESYYIDGARLKTNNKFFTPILEPAMEVLRKYDFRLRMMTNQKVNDYLHAIEYMLQLNKPLTFHVARHSFATLSLSHDVPIEKVARMLGHSDIKTTQIYAKILKESVVQHGQRLAASIL